MFKKSKMCGIGACVEVDTTPQAGVGGFSSETEIREGDVAIRDSKNPDIVLIFSCDEWGAFIVGVKNGEFDI